MRVASTARTKAARTRKVFQREGRVTGESVGESEDMFKGAGLVKGEKCHALLGLLRDRAVRGRMVAGGHRKPGEDQPQRGQCAPRDWRRPEPLAPRPAIWNQDHTLQAAEHRV